MIVSDNLNLMISTLFTFAASGVYIHIGRVLTRRPVLDSKSRLAWRLFTTWWFGLALTTFLGGMMNLLGLATDRVLLPMIFLTLLNLFSVCIALWGLLYYLLFLFTGNDRLLVPLSVFYVTYFLSLVSYIILAVPTGVSTGRWNAQLEYANPVEGPVVTILIVLLVLPQILGGLAYFTVFFKMRRPTQRYRIALVSWSIIIWFGITLLAATTGMAQSAWWNLASRLLGLGASLTILAAYMPPVWLRKRLDVIAITEEAAA